MAWESTTHRCSLPSDQMMGKMGVDSVWVCDEGTDRPGGCGRRWRIADRVDERVRWELAPERSRITAKRVVQPAIGTFG